LSDYLDRLIEAGYGDIDQPNIPAEVMQAAQQGREIPKPLHMRKKAAPPKTRQCLCFGCNIHFETVAVTKRVKWCPACRAKRWGNRLAPLNPLKRRRGAKV
jgi:hypothetical protein